MRQRKKVFKFSVTLAVLSLSSTFFLFFCTDRSGELGMFYDIMVNVFGGAILGTILTLVEYFTEKRNCLEMFYINANKLIKQLQNPRVLFYSDNEYFIGGEYGKAKKTIIAQKPLLLNELKQFVGYLNSISKTDRISFDNAYSSLDFLIGNKRLRPWIYINVYKGISDYFLTAEKLVNNLKTMDIESVENNYTFIANECKTIVQQWFYIKINGELNECTVYCNLRRLTFLLEELRSKIYHEKFDDVFTEDHLVIRTITRVKKLEIPLTPL